MNGAASLKVEEIAKYSTIADRGKGIFKQI